jgi:hypothetical protein
VGGVPGKEEEGGAVAVQVHGDRAEVGATEAHVNVAAHDAEHDAVAGHGAVAVNANDFVDDR